MTDIAQHPSYVTGTWKSDPTHSEISFTVRHLAISRVRGVFRDFDVTVVAPADESELSVEATIDVASADTGNETRDKHLLTGDFFLTDEHPTMTFRSTGVDYDGDDFTLHGDLTLRGVTKPVDLKGEFGGAVTDPYGNRKAGLTASTKINRKDFGVSWNVAVEGGVMVGDEVKIDIDLQLVLQSEA